MLKKHAANVVIKSDATARDEVFTDVQVNLSGEQMSRPPVRDSTNCRTSKPALLSCSCMVMCGSLRHCPYAQVLVINIAES